MAQDGFGNFTSGRNQLARLRTHGVKVMHAAQNPVGHLPATGQAVAIGVGRVTGYLWYKVTSGTSNTDWVVLMTPVNGVPTPVAGSPTTPGSGGTISIIGPSPT